MGESHAVHVRRALKAAHLLAVRQGGVVRREQLHELGLTRRDLTKQTASGIWATRGLKVLVLPNVGGEFVEESLVAAHSGWPRVCLTGASAIAVSGLTHKEPWDALPTPREPWIIGPGRVSVPCEIRHVRRAMPADALLVSGVWVAPPQVVMTDLLRFLPADEARSLAFRAAWSPQWRQRFGHMSAWVEDFAGKPGVAQLRQIALEVQRNIGSVAEKLAAELLTAAGITGWRANFRVRVKGHTFYLDIAFVSARLAIEIDGRRYHSGARWQSDLARQNLLQNAGWLVLRFTWEDLTARPQLFVAQVTEALAAKDKSSGV